jgi:hypothetical protein
MYRESFQSSNEDKSAKFEQGLLFNVSHLCRREPGIAGYF